MSDHDKTSDEEDNVIDKTVPSLPSFYTEMFNLEENPIESSEDKFNSLNWITEDLEKEINLCCPTKDEICNINNGRRNNDSFSNKCSKLFFAGRVFASRKQLDQVSEMFLKAWCCRKIHTSKSIRCFYNKQSYNKRLQHKNEPKRSHSSLKEVVCCPFKIQYSYIKKCLKKMPNSYYQIKLTKVISGHTCGLDRESFRIAEGKSGCTLPDLRGLSMLIDYIRENPNVSNSSLKPLIRKYVPFYQDLNSAKVNNFIARIYKFIIENPEDTELCVEDMNKITKSNPMDDQELILKDNSLLRINIRKITNLIT